MPLDLGLSSLLILDPPLYVVNSSSVSSFTSNLDIFWSNQKVCYNFRCDIARINQSLDVVHLSVDILLAVCLCAGRRYRYCAWCSEDPATCAAFCNFAQRYSPCWWYHHVDCWQGYFSCIFQHLTGVYQTPPLFPYLDANYVTKSTTNAICLLQENCVRQIALVVDKVKVKYCHLLSLLSPKADTHFTVPWWVEGWVVICVSVSTAVQCTCFNWVFAVTGTSVCLHGKSFRNASSQFCSWNYFGRGSATGICGLGQQLYFWLHLSKGLQCRYQTVLVDGD